MSHTPAPVREIAATIRHHRLTYAMFHKCVGQARKLAGINPSRAGKRLPKILPDAVLEKYFDTISRSGNLQHELMLKLMFYTAIRVSELTRIEMTDVDLDQSKIFIRQGKGDKDRYVLFAKSMRSLLRAYMALCSSNTYLFESRARRHYSTRRIHQIVKEYAEVAEIKERVHPHLFRHQMLTWLTRSGLGDAQIQLISGHASRETLEKYQHMALGDVSEEYQEAVGKVKI